MKKDYTQAVAISHMQQKYIKDLMQKNHELEERLKAGVQTPHSYVDPAAIIAAQSILLQSQIIERQNISGVLNESRNSQNSKPKNNHRVHFAHEDDDDDEYIVEKIKRKVIPAATNEEESDVLPHQTRGRGFGGPKPSQGGRGTRTDFTRGGMMRGGMHNRGVRGENEDTENQPPSSRHNFYSGTGRGGMRPSQGRG